MSLKKILERKQFEAEASKQAIKEMKNYTFLPEQVEEQDWTNMIVDVKNFRIMFIDFLENEFQERVEEFQEEHRFMFERMIDKQVNILGFYLSLINHKLLFTYRFSFQFILMI